MSRVELAYEDATLQIAIRDPVMFVRWHDAPSLAQAREFARLSYELSRRQPGGTALLNVIVRGTPRFTDGVRQEVVRMTADATLFRLGAAHVVLIGGLASAAVRAFLSTMLLVGRPKNPAKVFADAGAATTWLAERLGGTSLSQAEVLRIHEALLARKPGEEVG